jgi:hypothetical protein
MGTGKSKDGEIGDVEFRKATIYHVENGWVVFRQLESESGHGTFLAGNGERPASHCATKPLTKWNGAARPS